MRPLVLLLVCACGGQRAAAPASATQVSNRADAASPPPGECVPPETLTINARRRMNLDANDPDFGKTTPWHVIIVREADGELAVVMHGDQMHWTFSAHGVYDCAHAELTLDTHEPFRLELDVPSHRGRIESIDATWELF
jgi:hypothetical protein